MKTVKDKWDERWQERADRPLTPDPWLIRAQSFLEGTKVLDLACGRGRNALYLAEKGYTVTAVDLSEAGLSQIAATARARRLTIQLKQLDLEQAEQLPGGPYDAVLVFFYLQRSLLPLIQQAVRPGGIVVMRTFSEAGNFSSQLGNPLFALKPGELLQFFEGWEVLLHEEGLEESHRGGGLAGVVVRKPLTQAAVSL